MSICRPIRASKQRAIENIKKLVTEMNTYDDNGVLYEEDDAHITSSAEPTKITLEEVKETFVKSSYTPKILALLPTQFRNDFVEGDAIIRNCIDALFDMCYMYDYNKEPLDFVWSGWTPDLVTACNFYKHYSEDAIVYILNLMEEFEGGQE
jgi:hypothetical protein